MNALRRTPQNIKHKPPRSFTDFLELIENKYRTLDVDMKTLVEVNDLEETLRSRNPSFVKRILYEDD